MWSRPHIPARSHSMVQLIFHPATDDEERITFTVSEANLEDAISFGRVEDTMPFDEQISRTAYHMVLELLVCEDVGRICGQPWVVLRDAKIVACNHLAGHVRAEELA